MTIQEKAAQHGELTEPPVLLRIGHVYERSLGAIMSPTGFYGPLDMATGPDGMLYVLNRATTPYDFWRITKCLPQDDEYQGEINYREDEQPWAVSLALDSQGHFFITDDWADNVCVYDMDGKRIARWGEKGSAPGQFAGPLGSGWTRTRTSGSSIRRTIASSTSPARASTWGAGESSEASRANSTTHGALVSIHSPGTWWSRTGVTTASSDSAKTATSSRLSAGAVPETASFGSPAG